MSCPTCDHTMTGVGDGNFWCPRCGTIRKVGHYEGVPFLLDTFTVVAHDPERVAHHARLTAIGAHREALPVEGDVIRIGGTRP